MVTPTTLRALWQTGRLYPEQLPPIATDLLASGADSPALRELAGLERPTRADAGPVVERMLTELGAPRLEPAAACRAAAREIAVRALAGALDPYPAAASLGALWSDCGWPDYLTAFVAVLDEWDDFPAARGEMRAEILRSCREVVAVLGPGS